MKDSILTIIESRHSVRNYTEQPIATETVKELERLIELCNRKSGLHLQLVTNEPNAYGRSFWASYGKFSGVKNYICLVGPKKADEPLGYYGEILVLKAQELGLNTCWCGLSYNKKHAVVELRESERLYGLIAVGYGRTQGVKSKDKDLEQVSRGLENAPEWFRRGVACALLAPSAINQQKFRFEYLTGKKVKATTAFGPYAKMDLGIAKLHFEIGAAPEKPEWI